ncbi:DUF697 domain-containing protein [Pseudodesulfovibrio sp. zrk46]|uniref:DUF697 domain-containing protein n=1 Tax=Pseudodesulfovibrio sp. zrk46 TaxID=2725288 RepID=UPI001FFCB8E0|nr:DUF697 domain-containing protein [Pseudodesulfovibrio sp. zrk46]
MKNFITLAGLIIIGAFLAFLYNCVSGLALFAARFNPALEPWVFWSLLGAVGACLAWGGAIAFMRPKPMMVYADPSEEDLAAFRRELYRRLKKNKLLRDAELVINEEADMEAGLAYLREQSDIEIRDTAKRIFIATGISQNGRLDSLVVLFMLVRLTWRIAHIYNQRPHWREMVNLFANIGATSFLAGSIEEFGIEEYVHELMGPLIGGSAIGAVPGAQAIAGTITTSVLDGTTNCLLTLRCGIVARNYLSLDLDAKGAMRRSATLEASKVFMTMSGETVTYVTKALVKGAAGAVKKGSSKAARSVGNTISGTAEAVGSGARKVGGGVKGAAGAVGGGVKDAAGAVGSGVKGAADAVGGGARKVGEGVKGAAGTVGSGVKSAVDAVGSGVKGAANAVGDGAKKAGLGVKQATAKVGDGARKAGQSVREKVNAVTSKTAEKVAGARKSVEKKAEQVVKTSREVEAETVEAARETAGKGKRFLKSFSNSFRRIKKRKQD